MIFLILDNSRHVNSAKRANKSGLVLINSEIWGFIFHKLGQTWV